MKANILVVDDEETIRFSFQKFLAAEGHHVITAESYLEALARMDEMEFDLILADIVLDDGWGIDILQEVMKRKIKTRVIIITAYPTLQMTMAGFRIQAFDYLIKPLRQEELLYSVNKALQQMERVVEDEGSDPVDKALIGSDDS